MNCPGCGASGQGGFQFCPFCGVEILRLTAEAGLPEGIRRDEAGVLHWRYEKDLLRDKRTLKMLAGCLVVPFAVPALFCLLCGDPEGFWTLVLVMTGALAAVFLVWLWVVRGLYGGRICYEVLMDGERTALQEVPGDAGEYPGEKSPLLKALDRDGRIRTVSARTERGGCWFQEVKTLTARPRYDAISLRYGLLSCEIYASPGQFEYVWAHLTRHCSGAKIRRKNEAQ